MDRLLQPYLSIQFRFCSTGDGLSIPLLTGRLLCRTRRAHRERCCGPRLRRIHSDGARYASLALPSGHAPYARLDAMTVRTPQGSIQIDHSLSVFSNGDGPEYCSLEKYISKLLLCVTVLNYQCCPSHTPRRVNYSILCACEYGSNEYE